MNDSSDSLSYRLDEPKDALELEQKPLILQKAKSSHSPNEKEISVKNIPTKKSKRVGQKKANSYNAKGRQCKIPTSSCESNYKSTSSVKENNSSLDLHNSYSPQHSVTDSSCIFTRSRSHKSVSFRERVLRSHTKSPNFKNNFLTFENNFPKSDQASSNIPVKKNPSRASRKAKKFTEPPNLEIADMPNISVYSNSCIDGESRYGCRRSSLIMADPPVLTPVEMTNEKKVITSEKKSESLEVKTNSSLCSQGCLKLTVRVRNNSTDSDHSTASYSNDTNQQFCNLHNDITVQSKGMVYEIIPVKCNGNHDANESIVSKKLNGSIPKSKKTVPCASATDTVNIRISSPCYSHSLIKEEPELALDSPMKPGTKRVRLILGNDSIDIDIPPSKNRKCI